MSPFPFRRSMFLLALLSSVFWASSCATSSTEGADVKPLTGDEAREFLPYENTLAVSSSMRSFTLPLNNPGVVPADQATHMEEEDLVAGVVVDGQARAYPRWILVKYHVVNDTINEEPILIAHCEICSGTSAFRPVVDGFGGRSLIFDTYGPAKGTFSVYDYQTHTVWSPFTGRTLEGTLHATSMKRIPVMVERWGTWVKRFPKTDVVFASRLLIEQEDHGRGEHNEIGAEYIPKGFQTVANMEDTRLERNQLVFGIANVNGDEAVAFPLDFLERQAKGLSFELDGSHYFIRKIGEFGVAAFRLEEGQMDQTYQAVMETPFRFEDDRGGSWDEFGNALTEGTSDLAIADGYLTEWYEWVSSYPRSEIVS